MLADRAMLGRLVRRFRRYGWASVFWLVFPGTYGLEVLLLALVFGILLVDSLRITVTGTGERATLAGIVPLVE
jgi:hypothetical protein